MPPYFHKNLNKSNIHFIQQEEAHKNTGNITANLKILIRNHTKINKVLSQLCISKILNDF